MFSGTPGLYLLDASSPSCWDSPNRPQTLSDVPGGRLTQLGSAVLMGQKEGTNSSAAAGQGRGRPGKALGWPRWEPQSTSPLAAEQGLSDHLSPLVRWPLCSEFAKCDSFSYNK